MSSAIYKKTYLVDSGGEPNSTNASQDYGDPRHEKSLRCAERRAGGPEGERQARLDGVDGLPGQIEGVGQLGLRPVALGAQRRNRKLSYQGTTPPCRRRISFCIRLTPILTHRIPPHLNVMGVVHEPVEDSIRQRCFSNLFVAARNRQL